MHRSKLFALPLVLAACVAGACQSPTATPKQPAQTSPAAPAADKPLAYVAGEVVRTSDVVTALIEARGGEILAEIALDQLISAQLEQRNLTLTEQDLAKERQLVTDTLAPGDADQSARLLRELREQRGLGDTRFVSLIRRNAGLRKLIEDRVQITDAALQQERTFVYGPKYRVRLIVVDTPQQAADLRTRALAGESFSDLAVAHSTDPSAAQGGLLPLISLADPSFPQSVRQAIRKLGDQPKAISDAVAVDGGFALLQLERKFDAQQVEWDDIKDELTQRVRLRMQRTLMQQLARSLISDAKIVVLDPALAQSWRQQRQAMQP